MARGTTGVRRHEIDVTPSASRLTQSLRDIGYDFAGAVADLVDNSISAGARRVEVLIEFDGPRSRVLLADDGTGMSRSELTEALRFGSRRPYGEEDLGRYGLGLKTASLSQCRRVTVITRRAASYRRINALTLDLDQVVESDRWLVAEPPTDSSAYRALEWLDDGPGTVVLWEELDRVLPERRPEGGWARRRLEQLARRTSEYLGMVFHRFIEGEARERVVVSVNGMKVEPWNPFAPSEANRFELPAKRFEIAVNGIHGYVHFQPCVLPPKNLFSSTEEFERLGGPLKWNRQQGLYVYRADRLIQGGGWSGIRALDEHTKLARAALHFGTELDPLFQINVSKMRATLPPQVRTVIENPVHELCHLADTAYRRDGPARRIGSIAPNGRSSRHPDAAHLGAAILAAALDAGEHAAMSRVIANLKVNDPEASSTLGW